MHDCGMITSTKLAPNLRQRLRSWYILFFQLPWLPEWFLTLGRARAIGNVFSGWAVNKERFPAEVVDVYREAALRPGAVRAMVNYYRALVRGGSLRRQIALGFPQIETPTLVVWGEQDAALGKAEAAEAAEARALLHGGKRGRSVIPPGLCCR